MKKESQPLRLLRPAPSGWMLFDPPSEEPGEAHCEAFSSLAEVPAVPVCYSLPAHRVISEVFWIPAEEEDVVRESALLQLEVRGVLPPNASPEMSDLTLLRRDGGRTLVRADIFPTDLELPDGLDPLYFAASPLTGKIPGGTVCVWREESHVVLALGLPEGVLAWESRTDLKTGADVLAALEILLLEWNGAGLPCLVEKILDYSGMLEVETWNGIPVGHCATSLPPLEWPGRFPAWVPPAVKLRREALRQREKIVHLLQITGGALGVILLVLIGFFAWQRTTLALLEHEVTAAEELALPHRETARDWEELSGSIDPKLFALERLLLIVQALPGNGVRLSLFEINSAKLRIEGDARNVGLANLYYNSLRSAPGAQGFVWEMAPPALQPDNSAKFAIEASFPR